MAAGEGAYIHPSAEVSPGASVGPGTRIWRDVQVREGATIGRDCTLGKDVYVDRDVVIGDRVKIQNGACIYRGVTLEDGVFIGPHVTFTNDRYPRAASREWAVVPTRVRRGASIGANATIVCGVTIGEYALVGAGAVVTRDVPAHALAVGNPARVVGRVGEDGRPVSPTVAPAGARQPPGGALAGQTAEEAPAGRPARVRHRRLRVGVIGAGQMGRHHVRLLSAMGSGVILAGVADPDPEARRALAERYRVPLFPAAHDLLPEVDAVVVAVPTRAHFDVGMACLDAGRHVLMEKPVAATAAEAARLAAEAARRGLVLLPGHVERFNPALAELARALEGAGRVIGLQARRLSPFSSRGTDMDVMSDLMLHDLDIALHLVGEEVAACQGCAVAVRSPGADYAVATLRFAGGAVAGFVASRVSQGKVRVLEVTTEAGYYVLDFVDRKLLVTRDASSRQDGAVYRQKARVEQVSVPNAEPLALELAHFVACVRGQAVPAVKATEGVAVLDVIEAIRRHADVVPTPRPRGANTLSADVPGTPRDGIAWPAGDGIPPEPGRGGGDGRVGGADGCPG